MLIKIYIDPQRKEYSKKLVYATSGAGKLFIRVLRLHRKHGSITDTVKGPKIKSGMWPSQYYAHLKDKVRNYDSVLTQ